MLRSDIFLELFGIVSGNIARLLMCIPYTVCIIICGVIISTILKKIPGINKPIFWLEDKTLKKRDKIDKYGIWGLLLFVAIPLPGTGGWTGALLASLLHLDRKKSFGVICVGVFIAGLIITVLSLAFNVAVF